MSGRTACYRRLWRRRSRIAVSSCHGRPCHVERGGPRHGPPHPPSVRSAPAQPWRSSITREWPRHGPPGAAVTWLDELLAQLDLAAHGDGALGGDRPAFPPPPGRAAPRPERPVVEGGPAARRREGADPPPPVGIRAEVNPQRHADGPLTTTAR